MSTKALGLLSKRLEDIDRLLEAHRALSRLKRLESLLSGKTDIVRALAAAQLAFGEPLRGRRWGMEALNRAGIVLLTAHFEGYLEDLFEEASTVIASQVFLTSEYDVNAFTSQATSSFRSPRPQNIKDLFIRLGLPDVFAKVHWGTLKNSDVRKKLGDLVSLRNEIAHGERPSVTSKQLHNEVIFIRRLAKSLDVRLYDYVLKIAGVALW